MDKTAQIDRFPAITSVLLINVYCAYLPIVFHTPPPHTANLELPVSRVLHMFVPFLTADWLIRVHAWFIYNILRSPIRAVIFFRLFRLYFLIKLFSSHYILGRIFQGTPTSLRGYRIEIIYIETFLPAKYTRWFF